MRAFLSLLFMGSGECTVRDVDLLHQRLQDALSHSSGLQQSRGGEEEMDRKSTAEMEDVVRDIAAAVLGREVTFGETLPYPSPDTSALFEYWEQQQAKLAKDRHYPMPTEKEDRCSCTTHALLTVTRCQFHEVGHRSMYSARDAHYLKRIYRLARVWGNEKVYVQKLKAALQKIVDAIDDADGGAPMKPVGDAVKAAINTPKPPIAWKDPVFKPGEVYGYHPPMEYMELPMRADEEYVNPADLDL